MFLPPTKYDRHVSDGVLSLRPKPWFATIIKPNAKFMFPQTTQGKCPWNIKLLGSIMQLLNSSSNFFSTLIICCFKMYNINSNSQVYLYFLLA